MIEYIELRYPLGQRRVMTMAAYAELPLEEVRGTRARIVTRAELVRLVMERRYGRAS